MARSNTFDPVARLSTLEDGSQYLGARERLLWFLGEQDEYSVASQVERLSSTMVIVKVTVAVGNGKKVEALGSAAANGDYRAIETAETHALGRALALLGYGTEAALDLDTKTIVDSPARPQQQRPPQVESNGHGSSPGDLPSVATATAGRNGGGVNGKAPSGTYAEPEDKGERPGETTRHDAQPALTCADCQGPIKEGKTRDGTILTPEDVAARAQKRFGRRLCARCLVKEMAQDKPKEAQPT